MEDIYTPILISTFEKAKKINIKAVTGLDDEELKDLETIVFESESLKGVYSVLVTSFVEKIANPRQDIRKHQANMPGGYSGRTIDTRFITPFLKKVGFTAMKESGWLTRSLEQNYPYDLNYKGKIRNKKVKHAFLRLLNNIQAKGKQADKYLLILFSFSIIQKEGKKISLVTPATKDSRITIDNIIALLFEHFNRKYKARGASRLPVLAIYSVYQIVTKELKRFYGKILLPLEEHTSADSRSGMIGDIAVTNQDGIFFEGVEIKHKVPITKNMVFDSFEKIKAYPISRYYLLTTAEPSSNEPQAIKEYVKQIRETHGCQVIVNGVMPTLKYYLRLINNIDEFIGLYMKNIELDSVITREHRVAWNELVKKHAADQ